MIIPAEGFPVYDIAGMRSSGAEISDGEELCARILKSNKVGGFTHNKALRREIIGDICFDEGISYCEDVDWLISIALARKNIRVCYVERWLYCYVAHENEGLTRDPSKVYTEDGYPRELYACGKIYARKDLPERAAELIRANFYSVAVDALYAGYARPGSSAYMKLRQYIKEYASSYYLRSGNTLKQKAKKFVKRCLVFLHIHKPRRK